MLFRSVLIVGRMQTVLSVLLFAGILFVLGSPKPRPLFKRAASLVIFCLVVFAAQEIWRQTHREFRMTVLDVGQGDAIYFEFPKGGNMLVDAGGARFSDKGRWVISPFLKSKGVRTLDAIVISHPQEDHIGGFMAVMDDFRVKKVFHGGKFYPSYLWKQIQRRIAVEKSDVRVVGKGDKIEDFPGVQVSVLGPDKDFSHKNINDDSVVLKIGYGEDSFLLTGDIQTPAMHDLLLSEQALEADVLKVPHHGAKLTSEGMAFVQEVHPTFSPISVGERNPFGHPAPVTLEALSAIPGNQVLRTDEKGAISLVSDGHGLKLDWAR